MNIGELIFAKMEEKKMHRKELYEIIKSSFYDLHGEKYVSVPTFYSRIEQNKIPAEDLLYMSAVLDINLADIQAKIKKLIRTNKQGVCSHFKLLMKAYSTCYSKYSSNEDDVEYMSTNESSSYVNNRFYMITMNHIEKIASLELFDFDMQEVKTLININLNEKLDGYTYEVFKSLTREDKLNYLKYKKTEYELLFGTKKFEGMYRQQHRKFDLPDDISYKIEFIWNSTIKLEYSESRRKEIEDAIQAKISTGIGYGCENKVETLRDNPDKRASFRIISSDARYEYGELYIYNKVQIEEIW